MILSNFHTHTTFTDGNNNAEEMVISAINAGLHTLGFSEHAYVSFDPNCCLSKEDTTVYKNEIKRLKRKYEDKINILCGIEADFYSQDDFSAYDYVIGSVHYIKIGEEIYSVDISPKETMRCINNEFGGNSLDYAAYYFETISKLYEKTGADIIGHFDLINKFSKSILLFDKTDAFYINSWKNAMNSLYKNSVFEINTGAVSRGYSTLPYPDFDMLKELNNLGGKILISSDAHSSAAITFGFDEAKKTAKESGFKTAGFIDRNLKLHVQF